MIFFFNNILFLFITILSFFISLFKNLHHGLYFVAFKEAENNKLIDPRSKIYCTENNLAKNINFVRCFNLISVLKLFLKHQNIFIINSIEFFFSTKNTKKIVEKIFYLNNIKFFKMIDDYRYLDIFLPITKQLKIKSTGYMHGRISKNLSYQRPLFRNEFDKYYVWSKYFKKKILDLNHKYNPKNIIIQKTFKKKNTIKNFKINYCKKNILILEEDSVPKSLYSKLIKEIKKIKNNEKYNLYFKARLNNKLDKNFKDYCNLNGVKFYHKKNLSNLIVEKKINFVFGTNSSFLYICSLNNIFPISLDCKFLLSDLKDEKLIFIINLKKNLEYQFNKIFSNKKKIKEIKEKIWS